MAQVIKPLCGAETWVEIEDYGQAKADVQQVFEWARQTDVKDVDHEFYETVEGGHGRIEMRCYWLLGATEHLVN
ncbi:MAG TPA: hypothetical protein IGQ15_02245, partial [Thermosynechococcus sp. M98_K2018_005]|nr:hypothetical protein [Thermosynechococcus sp. M98_K2018_005]